MLTDLVTVFHPWRMLENRRIVLVFRLPESGIVQNVVVVENHLCMPRVEANRAAAPMAIRTWTRDFDPAFHRAVLDRCGSRALPPVEVRMMGLAEPVKGSTLYFSHVVASALELGRPSAEGTDSRGQRVESRQPFSWLWLRDLPDLQLSLGLSPGLWSAADRARGVLGYDLERSVLQRWAPRDVPWLELLEKCLTPDLCLVTDPVIYLDEYKVFLAKAVELHNAQVEKSQDRAGDTPGFADAKYRKRLQSGLREYATKLGWDQAKLRSVVAVAAAHDMAVHALCNRWLWDVISDTVEVPPSAAERELYTWAHVRLSYLRTGAVHGPLYWDAVPWSLFTSMSDTLRERVLYVAAQQANYPQDWDEEVRTALRGYLAVYREYLIAMRQLRRQKKSAPRRVVASKQQSSQDRLAPDRAIETAESRKALWERALDQLEKEADELRGRPDERPLYSSASIGRYAERDGADPENHVLLAKRIIAKILMKHPAGARDLELLREGKSPQQIADTTSRTRRVVSANIRRARALILERTSGMDAVHTIILAHLGCEIVLDP